MKRIMVGMFSLAALVGMATISAKTVRAEDGASLESAKLESGVGFGEIGSLVDTAETAPQAFRLLCDSDVCVCRDSKLPPGRHDNETGYNKITLEQVLATRNGECVDLRGINLSRRDLKGLNLRGANLEGANFKLTSLVEVDLTGAHLENAVLRGVYMSQVDLRKAMIQGVDLRTADIAGSNLGGASLWGAMYSAKTKFPLFFGPDRTDDMVYDGSCRVLKFKRDIVIRNDYRGTWTEHIEDCYTGGGVTMDWNSHGHGR